MLDGSSCGLDISLLTHFWVQMYDEISSPQNKMTKFRQSLMVFNISHMETTINERINAILQVVYKGNVTAMAKSTYIKRTTINSIVGPSETSPGFDVLAKLGEISSPCISMEWLIRGVGNMILDHVPVPSSVNSSVVGDNNANNSITTVNEDATKCLIGQLVEKDKQINQLLQILAAK